MSRKKTTTTFVPPIFTETVRTLFLNAGFRFFPEALHLLARGAHAGNITAQDWAASYAVDGTWIQKWAEKTLGYWTLYPDSIQIDPASGAVLTCFYPPPEVEATGADDFSFLVSKVRPPSPYAMGVLSAGRLQDPLNDAYDRLVEARRSHQAALERQQRAKTDAERKRAANDLAEINTRIEAAMQAMAALDTWDSFASALHAELDRQLDQFRINAARSGASREIRIPGDIALKIEVAALYVFGLIRPLAIGELKGVGGRDRTAVNRWLKEILPLLDLKMRPKGWQPQPKR